MNNEINSENIPLVSVCMITYNHEKYISQSIDGVLMQKTDFPIELVIGEDCSTDNTRNLCMEYKEKYPDKIKLLLPEKNLGMIQNFNATIQSCAGKYIALCEGDDYWIDPYKLQKQVDFLEANPDFSFVYTDVDIYYEDIKYKQTAIIRNGITFLDNDNPIKSRGYLANLTWLFRKTVLQLFSIENNCVDAALFMFYEIAQQTKIHYIPEVTGIYRKHLSSASCHIDENKQLQFELKAFEIQLNYVKKYKIEERISFPVLFQAATYLLEKALGLNDKYVSELLFVFFNQKNIMPEAIVNLLLQKQQEMRAIKASKAYQLGNFLLKPFAVLRKLGSTIRIFILSFFCSLINKKQRR